MKKITIKYISDYDREHSFFCDSYTSSIKEDVLEVTAVYNKKYTHIILNTRNFLFFAEET